MGTVSPAGERDRRRDQAWGLSMQWKLPSAQPSLQEVLEAHMMREREREREQEEGKEEEREERACSQGGSWKTCRTLSCCIIIKETKCGLKNCGEGSQKISGTDSGLT